MLHIVKRLAGRSEQVVGKSGKFSFLLEWRTSRREWHRSRGVEYRFSFASVSLHDWPPHNRIFVVRKSLTHDDETVRRGQACLFCNDTRTSHLIAMQGGDLRPDKCMSGCMGAWAHLFRWGSQYHYFVDWSKKGLAHLSRFKGLE